MDQAFGTTASLSNSQPDPSVKPFLGYFAPSTDGALIALINTSTPGHPERDSYSVGSLAEQRFLALDVLEKANVADEQHAYAEWIVHTAGEIGKPFGLYLRNFVLGARVVPGRNYAGGTGAQLTLANADDPRMQSLITERGNDLLMPFITIANRVMSFNVIPSLVFSNDNWERAAELLIEHAGVIVLFFLTLTPGVDEEIDLLRAAGAADRTLIVVADKDPRQSGMDNHMLQFYGSESAIESSSSQSSAEDNTQSAEFRLPPADFPHQIRLKDEADDWKGVKEALESLIRRATPPPTSKMPALPPQDRPSQEILDMARDRALQEFQLAKGFMEKGEGGQAEDALIRSIAFSHWSRDRLGRAMAFMMLGSAERFLLKYPNEAVSSYFHALDLFESLLMDSEIAVKAFKPLANQLAAYLEELGDPKGAQYVLDRLKQYTQDDGSDHA